VDTPHPHLSHFHADLRILVFHDGHAGIRGLHSDSHLCCTASDETDLRAQPQQCITNLNCAYKWLTISLFHQPCKQSGMVLTSQESRGRDKAQVKQTDTQHDPRQGRPLIALCRTMYNYCRASGLRNIPVHVALLVVQFWNNGCMLHDQKSNPFPSITSANFPESYVTILTGFVK
jgi:hypothetical protein